MPCIYVHCAQIHVYEWMDEWIDRSARAGEVGGAGLAALVEEEDDVGAQVEADNAEDVGLDSGAEADGGVQVDETVQQRAALLVRRHDVA